MSSEEWQKNLARLEFQISLLTKMTKHTPYAFDHLIVKSNLGQAEYIQIERICEELSKELEDQKAEGFVHFDPLYEKFAQQLPKPLKAEEVVNACITQGLYLPLMKEFVHSLPLG